eukprot:164168-Prymnesium_polylepis.1
MRVPTCSARPTPRYAVLYRFHFSARRALARGLGDCALYRAPIRGPGRLYYELRVKGRYIVTNSDTRAGYATD